MQPKWRRLRTWGPPRGVRCGNSSAFKNRPTNHEKPLAGSTIAGSLEQSHGEGQISPLGYEYAGAAAAKVAPRLGARYQFQILRDEALTSGPAAYLKAFGSR